MRREMRSWSLELDLNLPEVHVMKFTTVTKRAKNDVGEKKRNETK